MTPAPLLTTVGAPAVVLKHTAGYAVVAGPEPNFAGLARAMGGWGEGPIERPEDVRPALLRAVEEVRKGRVALVDTITQHR